MTKAEIQRAAKREQIKHGAAVAIRDILAKARTEYGTALWDENDVEAEVLSLVTDDAADELDDQDGAAPVAGAAPPEGQGAGP